MFPRQCAACDCHITFWTFLYDLYTGLNLGKHGINTYCNIGHCIMSRLPKNYNTMETIGGTEPIRIFNLNANGNSNENTKTSAMCNIHVFDENGNMWCHILLG